MVKNAVLADSGMIIDPVHDGRHVLDDKPHARESIPYIVVLPEHQIALFTYTWVSQQSVAGAALSVFGPGLGQEPIRQRLADRSVLADMNFDKWAIEGFRMEQDLQFTKSYIRWQTPEATVEFNYEATHPPYAYGTDPRGCPPFFADNRIEQAGVVTGRLTIGDRIIDFKGTGHRDHSWGTRDWAVIQHHEWYVGQVGDEIGIHLWRGQGAGKTHIRGYVFKDGVQALIETADVNVTYDRDYWQKSYSIRIVDSQGRTTTVETEVYAADALIPDPCIVLRESAGVSIIDGKTGVGWMECAWPTAYLDHIVANGPY
jgi:hypothetical protein